MRVLSLRDVQKVPEFSHMSELEIINPKNDEALLPVFHAIGIDINKPFQYHAANHRSWDKKVGVGIYVVGEMRQDDEFRRSGLCSAFERIVLNGKKDVSLMLDLCELSGKVLNFKSFHEEHEADEMEHEDLPEGLTEPNWSDTAQQIAALEGAIFAIRGNPYREDGSLKMWNEYK